MLDELKCGLQVLGRQCSCSVCPLMILQKVAARSEIPRFAIMVAITLRDFRRIVISLSV